MNTALIYCGICGKADPVSLLQHIRDDHNIPEDVYRVLDAATKNTKFTGVRPHLLRHALRTNMYEAGVDEILIDAYLGHTTKEMGDHYRHIRAKRLVNGARAYAEARASAATSVATSNPGNVIRPAGDVPSCTGHESEQPPIFKFSLLG